MNARPETLGASCFSVDAAPVHKARVLTQGGTLVRISLDGQVYTLRITRQGELILTK